MNERRDSIRAFIAEEILMDPDLAPADEEPLLISGLLDSLGVMRLIYFLEEQSQTKIPFTDITIENFDSIASIDDYLSGT